MHSITLQGMSVRHMRLIIEIVIFDTFMEIVRLFCYAVYLLMTVTVDFELYSLRTRIVCS